MPKQVSGLPSAATVAATDLSIVHQNTTTRQATLQVYRNYFAPEWLEQASYPATDLDITANPNDSWIDTGYTITLAAIGTYNAECSILPLVIGATGDAPKLEFRMLLDGVTEVKGSREIINLFQTGGLFFGMVRIRSAQFTTAATNRVLKIQVRKTQDSGSYASTDTRLYRIQGAGAVGGDKYFGVYRLK